MKTEKHFSIKDFLASYYPSDLSKKGNEIVFLCLDESHTFPENPFQIHFYMIIAGLRGRCRIKAGSHEFLIKANSISIIPAATWIGMEKAMEAFEAQVILFDQDFLKKGLANHEILNDLLFINPYYPPTFPLKRK